MRKREIQGNTGNLLGKREGKLFTKNFPMVMTGTADRSGGSMVSGKTAAPFGVRAYCRQEERQKELQLPFYLVYMGVMHIIQSVGSRSFLWSLWE